MVNGKTLYSKLAPEDVADYVIVSGDPWRVEVLAKDLDDAKHIAFNRQFNTYTGFYKGLRVTITSLGMGSASAIELLEELVDCGAKVIVRMGTAGPFDDNDFAKFLIADSGMATDNVSVKYAPENYPIVADWRLVKCLEDAVKSFGYESKTGIAYSSDGGEPYLSITKYGEKRRRIYPYYQTVQEFQEWGKVYGCTMMDFESAPMIKVGNLIGVTVGSICLATVILDRNKKMLHTDPSRLKEMEAALCRVALEGVYLLDQRYRDDVLKEVNYD